MDNSEFYSFIDESSSRSNINIVDNSSGGIGEEVGVVIPVYSEVFIPDRKSNVNNIENEFQKRFEEFTNNIILPNPEKEKSIGKWDDLCDKIENFLHTKIAEYYGDTTIDKIRDIKEDTKVDFEQSLQEFERKFKLLVSERSTLLSEAKEIMVENSDILIENPETNVKDIENKIGDDMDIDETISLKYNFKSSKLHEQLRLYERAVIDSGKKMVEYKQKIEKAHENIHNIKKWVNDVPSIFKKNKDLDVVHEAVMGQLKKYFEESYYVKLLEEYKESYIHFLYLLSQSENFFTKPNKCTICMISDITHTFAPCGHCYCLGCANKIQRNKCHICRQIVKSKVKLHI
jgi:hypothetical protein